jgi:4-hydroxybenzoate polyprenyltransferase
MRLKQWTKNLFLFAALVFSQKLNDLPASLSVGAGFLLFSLIASGGYILNDIIDAEKDRTHPIKQRRPITSGALSKKAALISATAFLSISFILSFCLSVQFFLVALAYLLIMFLYSFWLKNIVILDVMTISAGFVLRVKAGAVIIPVEVSLWLLICTMLLALFLALSKRRHELVLLEDSAPSHRTILSEYTPAFIDEMISAVTGGLLIAYSLYAFSPETQERFGKTLPLTIPFVLYGIFRYLYLVHQKGKGGRPEIDIVSDKPMMIGICCWVISILLIIYL